MSKPLTLAIVGGLALMSGSAHAVGLVGAGAVNFFISSVNGSDLLSSSEINILAGIASGGAGSYSGLSIGADNTGSWVLDLNNLNTAGSNGWNGTFGTFTNGLTGFTAFLTGQSQTFNGMSQLTGEAETVYLFGTMTPTATDPVPPFSGGPGPISGFDPTSVSEVITLNESIVPPSQTSDQFQSYSGSMTFASPAQLFTPPSSPEPATLSLFGAGLAGLGWLRRRRK